jgi:hypothetical protein
LAVWAVMKSAWNVSVGMGPGTENAGSVGVGGAQKDVFKVGFVGWVGERGNVGKVGQAVGSGFGEKLGPLMLVGGAVEEVGVEGSG